MIIIKFQKLLKSFRQLWKKLILLHRLNVIGTRMKKNGIGLFVFLMPNKIILIIINFLREHFAHLHATRKAWRIPPWPLYFDTINFYKYITKSRLLTGTDANLYFNEYYNLNEISSESINCFEAFLSLFF